MEWSFIHGIILAVVLMMAHSAPNTTDSVEVINEELTMSIGVKISFQYSGSSNNSKAKPTITCEPSGKTDQSIESGILIKHVPLLEKEGLMIKFSLRNGSVASCHLLPQQYAGELEPSTSLVPKGGPSPMCPKGWTYLKPFCYLISFGKGSWIQAEDFCKFWGSQLATITNDFQQNMLSNMLTEDTWIGLKNNSGQQTLAWLDGTVLNYTSWSDAVSSSIMSEPIKEDDRSCVGMKQSKEFDWELDLCSIEKRFLCSVEEEDAFIATKSCPKGWYGYERSCFYLSGDVGTWDESERHCTTMDSHLASPTDVAQHLFLSEMISDSHWIGLNDRDSTGNYTWTDGSQYNFTLWNEGQPSHTDSSFGLMKHYENCVEMKSGFNFLWNDEKCSQHNFYICEKEVSHLVAN